MTIYKFKEVEFSFNLKLKQALAKIYGFGLSKANNFICKLGFGKNFSINDINGYFFNIITVLLKSQFILGFRIKEIHLQRMEFYFENNFVRGYRLFNGLPNNGQRTHSNYRTAKRLKPFSEKFNSIIIEKKRQLLEYAKRKIKKKN